MSCQGRPFELIKVRDPGENEVGESGSTFILSDSRLSQVPAVTLIDALDTLVIFGNYSEVLFFLFPSSLSSSFSFFSSLSLFSFLFFPSKM